jgi:hypothetical protein
MPENEPNVDGIILLQRFENLVCTKIQDEALRIYSAEVESQSESSLIIETMRLELSRARFLGKALSLLTSPAEPFFSPRLVLSIPLQVKLHTIPLSEKGSWNTFGLLTVLYKYFASVVQHDKSAQNWKSLIERYTERKCTDVIRNLFDIDEVRDILFYLGDHSVYPEAFRQLELF